jgi:FixJ family two-component response regulator
MTSPTVRRGALSPPFGDRAAPAAASTRRIDQLQQGVLISIIDDDESVRSATRSLVRSLGFTAHTFASAEDFLISDSAKNSSCIITDIQMPGLSGVELQRLLIAQGNNTSLIFITAFPDEAIRERVLEAGAICLLTKPCDGQSLVRCLERALDRRDGGSLDR